MGQTIKIRKYNFRKYNFPQIGEVKNRNDKIGTFEICTKPLVTKDAGDHGLPLFSKSSTMDNLSEFIPH